MHIYQPANSENRQIKEAAEKSYARLVRALKKNSRIKFTLNVTGCLLVRLEELGFKELINRIRALSERGQIELVGSAMYHPLLPLIPEKEIMKQIQENEKVLKKYFPKIKLNGFFLPEMAYNEKVGRIIKKSGYKWIILDEVSYNGKLGQVDFNKVYKTKNDLKIIFRSRKFSQIYLPDHKSILKEKLVITATDGELYGLRHIDPTGEFEKFLKEQSLKTQTVSEFINSKKSSTKINPLAASWETTEKEVKKNPFALWQNKNNKIQKNLWLLSGLAYDTVEKFKQDKKYEWARWHLDRGLASCTFWWASGRDFHKVFGPVSWGPDEIERGVNELIRAIRSLDDKKTKTIKLKAEKLHAKIRQMIWEEHWKKYWKRDESR